MENILPSFGQSRHRDDMDEYGRRSRPTYAPGVYEYTGQPQGFEHLGSPPKQRLEDMDARTIAQLGYEGPEGERRKVQAINEQIYEREGYRNGVPIEGYRFREGYSDGYDRDRQYSRQGGSGPPLRSQEEMEYRRTGRRPGDRYDDRYDRAYDPRGRTLPPVIPVTVERKYEEDGTVVENLYPDNTTAALYSRPDHGKIHYGRQDSFPETVLQEAAESSYRHGSRYPPGGGRYPDDRLPARGYAPPYDPATSSYGRRPYEGSSSDYIDPNYRRY